MNRREAVKALNIKPKDHDIILAWAADYLAFMPPGPKDRRHYSASWSLNPELMVLTMKQGGKHIADTLLPLGQLGPILSRNRIMTAMSEDIGKGMGRLMDQEIVKALEGEPK